MTLESRTLTKDIEDVRTLHDHLRACEQDENRVVAVVAGATGCGPLLRGSIPRLLHQFSQVGLPVQLIVGLNDGTECDDVWVDLGRLPESTIEHMYCSARTDPATPSVARKSQSPISDQAFLQDAGSFHKITVVHQGSGLFSSGKIRVLGDIFDLILSSIDAGWRLPSVFLAFDAESHFCLQGSVRPPNYDLQNPLFHLLLELRAHHLDIIGTRVHFSAYETAGTCTKSSDPVFSTTIPAIFRAINELHGRTSGFMWLPGGGMLGTTNKVLSILNTIARKYPGARIEDSHATVIASAAGFKYAISKAVASTNRCPSDSSNSSANLDQVYRWLRGVKALEALYGRAAVEEVALCEFTPHLSTLIKSMDTWAAKGIDARRVFWDFRKALRRAALTPDVLSGPASSGGW